MAEVRLGLLRIDLPPFPTLVHSRAIQSVVQAVSLEQSPSRKQDLQLGLYLLLLRHRMRVADVAPEFRSGWILTYVLCIPPSLLLIRIFIAVPIDGFYLSGWKIMILTLIVFPGLGNLASIILRFRLKVPGTGRFSWFQFKYLRKYLPIADHQAQATNNPPVFFSVFFTGLSMQISSALICHLVGYQMTWSATVKTVEASNFFKEVPAIIKKFKITLPVNLLVIVSRAKPRNTISSHLLLPLVPDRYRPDRFAIDASRLEGHQYRGNCANGHVRRWSFPLSQ